MFKKIGKYFKAINKKVAKVQVIVLLTLIYFLIITPLGFCQRVLKKSDRNRKGSYWQEVKVTISTLENAYKQY